ncbi:hypothetical protein G6F64_014646 [Rhizopus arrhizus]|uniref:Uncharacterized protein n=1 Tax=Rhizopus oryzae TaxID=64495 RepID=A0A9P6WT12_RHIOR|nr:hypothetical protein G6F64_014646 [Rhizopus arrhizus]
MQGVTVPPLHGVVVVALQVLAVGAQITLVTLADGDAGVAFHPVAIDAMAVDARAHRLHGIARPVEQAAGIVAAALALPLLHLAAVANQRLPAVAPGGAPADPLCFQQDHPMAPCRQFQCRGQAGIAGAKHGYIGLHIAPQRG